MKLRIPSFLSKRKASAKSPEEVAELIAKYKNWADSDISKELLSNLEHLIEKQVLEDEKELGFISRFQFNYKHAHSRGYREALRTVIKQFQYEA